MKYVFPVLLNQRITYFAWFYYKSLPANGPKKKKAYLFVFILNALHISISVPDHKHVFFVETKNASIMRLTKIAMTISGFLALALADIKFTTRKSRS